MEMKARWVIPGDDLSAFNKIEPYRLAVNGAPLVSNTTDAVKVVHFFKWPCKGPCPELSRQMAQLQNRYRKDPHLLLLSMAYAEDPDPGQAELYREKYRMDPGKWHLLYAHPSQMPGVIHPSYLVDVEGSVPVIPNSEYVYLVDTADFLRGMYRLSEPVELENLYLDIGIQQKASGF